MKLLAILFSVLPAILAGDFVPQTLSIAEQDSILNVQSTKEEAVCTRYRLEYENEEKLFRHSREADWFVLDSMRHTRKQLGAGLQLGKVRDAVMSPNGRYVAFAKGNNLYIHKLDFGTEVAVTKDENTDIINGIADWLYEEEFGTTALFAWSPDSKQLAFVKLDETEVPSFSWQYYLDTSYPTTDSLRYPKAGFPNAKARVCVYDVATKGIVTMQVNADDVYFPRLRWKDGNTLMVLRVNRDQTKMEVLSCNSKSTVSHLLYKEESKNCFVDYKEESKNCFVDYALFDEWKWLSDGRFIVLSEQDGWRRAYLYNAQGVKQRALTAEGMDVNAVYAMDETTQTLYYQAAPTPATRHIYAVSLKNPEVRIQLSEGEGMHSARFSEDGKRMIECFQSFDTPNRYTLCEIKNAKIKTLTVLENNDSVREAWAAYSLPEPQMMRIPGANGQELEAMLLTGQQPTAKSQQPLVLMHYSGPASQRVLNRWRKRFEYALVEAGYAVLIVDVRGSDCRGRAWRNETYMSLGQKEAEDLIAAAQWAAQQPYIDGNRMAILGGSTTPVIRSDTCAVRR